MDLYYILELQSNASQDDIKKAYKKLALKYHPDKSKDKNTDKFQSISMAYEILSDPEQRSRYDKMNPQKKDTIFEMIINISTNLKQNIHKYITNDEEYKNIIASGNPELIKEFIFTKLNNYIIKTLTDKTKDAPDAKDEDISNIFISDKIDKKSYDIIDKNMSIESSIIDNSSNNDNIIELSIITDLVEIYMNKLKEITVQRQRFKNKQIIFDNKMFYIPLQDDKIILEKEGDDYIDSNGLLQRGDIIIKIKCKKHKYLQRVNDYDILLVLPITLYELFHGFEKTFKYLDDKEMKIKSDNPLNDYKFDGDKIIIIINNKGLVIDEIARGNLIIYLALNKDKNFIKKIKKYFN